jgi:hypothetical protein
MKNQLIRVSKIIGYAACIAGFWVLLGCIAGGCGKAYKESLGGREHVRQYQSKANYSLDTWAKDYNRINNRRERPKPSVTVKKSNAVTRMFSGL